MGRCPRSASRASRTSPDSQESRGQMELARLISVEKSSQTGERAGRSAKGTCSLAERSLVGLPAGLLCFSRAASLLSRAQDSPRRSDAFGAIASRASISASA
jgi:hypothetical protein